MISSGDKVTISNKALAMIGVSAITAMTDATDQARFCNALFEDLVYELLEEHDWRFIRIASAELSRYEVAETEVVPKFGFRYLYSLPANCFTVLELWEKDPADSTDYGSKSKYEWRVELSPDGSTLVLNTDLDDDVAIRYAYITGTSKTNYSYLFWRVFRLRLAALLAVALHGNTAMANILEAKAVTAMEKATIRDVHWSHEEDDDSRDDCSWQKAGR